MPHGKREIEIKFRVRDEAGLRRRLAESGARFEGRYREENFFFDDADDSLRRSRRILRLRRSTELGTPTTAVEGRLTYKEPVADERFKVRDEYEVRLDDVDGMATILGRLGYRRDRQYEKERALYRLGEALVTFDTLSIGQFVEIEGRPDAIATAAQLLGFELAEGITQSYLTLLDTPLP